MNKISNNKREVKLEQFFTKNSLAEECVKKVCDKFNLDSFDRIIEPSAGAGAFLKILPESAVGYDIEPKSDSIIKQDFLSLSLSEAGKTICIGNPPFGARGGLALKFLNKCCEFSCVVAFILPRSFKKYTFKNSINLSFHLVEEFDCEDFITPDGQEVKIKCVFQIWEKRDYKREKEQTETTDDFKMKHYHFSQCSKEDLDNMKTYDFAIAQVGSNFSPKDISSINKGSYWFIKGGDRNIFEKCDYSFLDGMNTAFKSLSKNDIIKAYKIAKEKHEQKN